MNLTSSKTDNILFLGSGGYGLVIGKKYKGKDLALKMFYDIYDNKKIDIEVENQEKCRKIIEGLNLEIYIPKIYKKYNKINELNLNFDSKKSLKFLSGILMERIKPPKIEGFEENEQIHIGLGLQNESNMSWICENGITRGFYANTEMLESILDEVKDSKENDLYFPIINDIAYTIGKAYSELFKNGIKPFDVELVIDENLKIWMIDFGKVINFPEVYNFPENIKKLKEDYYNDTSYRGLASDLYVPHKIRNDKYWEDFYKGFFEE